MPPRRGRWDQEAGRDMTPPAWLPVVLPSLLIGLMLAASLIYLSAGDGWRATYWFAGALLNIAVTYGIR